ncbi:expressed unknown protein [Seminavis robusta]|uniref:MYND-type domain-containing protein n=1 Tax=Seminavis robusta TaxID=568900 RepID=A0A9N8HV76_9STRA|nr:expressed unknown protein [Seminavis robusta]|eukprot:Sro2256_g321030.1 n/a (477) ;mRNA; f:3842-5272
MPSNKKKCTKKKLAKHPERISPKKLAQAMPEVLERLQSGNVADKEAAYLEVLTSVGPKVDKIMTKDGRTHNKPELKALVLAGLAVSGSSEAAQDLKNSLKSIMLKYVNAMDENEGEVAFSLEKSKEIQFRTQKCFDEGIDEMKDEIISTCYNGSEEAFKTTCPAYKASRDVFWHHFRQTFWSMIDTNLKEMMEKFDTATAGVQMGMHKSKWVCWKCGEEAAFCCTQCHVAKYCSKECQRAHWQTSHHPTCKSLHDVYAPFKVDQTTVEKAHGNPEEHATKFCIEPAVEDFHLLWIASRNHIFQKQLFVTGEEGATGVLGTAEAFLDHHFPDNKGRNTPTMTNFYGNVKKLVEDGFLLSPGSHNVSPQKCVRDRKAFLAVSQAMMFDYSTLPVMLQMPFFYVVVTDAYGSEDFSMSAGEWLYNYCDGDRYNENAFLDCNAAAERKFDAKRCRYFADFNTHEYLRENAGDFVKPSEKP